MKTKSFWTIAIFASLLLVCALAAMTVFGSLGWAGSSASDLRILDVNMESAEVVVSESYNPAAELKIQSDAGDIMVRAADVESIEVEMVKKAWGSSQVEAQDAAEALSISVTETSERLTLVFEKPDRIGIMSTRGGNDHIQFNVRVPDNTALDLKTSFGDIDISGTVGNAVLDTRFGDITASEIQGELQADSANADIELSRIDAGEGEISAKTSFGQIEVEDITAGSLKLETSNGDVDANTVTLSGGWEINTSFGNVSLHELSAGSILIDNQNGRILLEGGQVSGGLTATNRFGDVVSHGIEAESYDLSTSNGMIDLDGASGRLDLETSFGGIAVRNAEDAVLQVQSSNGPIEFEGSLDSRSSHSVETSFGDIRLKLPAGSAFDLSLRTSFGRISSDIPVTLSGSIENGPSRSEWDATINGGGPEIEAVTSNGDITISVLKEQ